MRMRGVVGLFCLLVGACDGGGGETVDGAPPDVRVPVPDAALDAPVPDADPPDAPPPDADPPDAPPPDAPPPDADPPDAPPLPDAIVAGTIPEFGTCFIDGDCVAGLDCRSIPWVGGEKQCIRDCDTTADCPFHTFCYPTGGGSLGPSFALMGDHCWYSLCGEAFAGTTPASVTGGPCELGAEAGVAASDRLPGLCLSISDALFGQCLEAGTVAAGATCDFAAPVRGGANCDATSLCVGMSGATTGTCAQLCSPQFILTGDPTGCTTMGETCFDASSLYTYADGSTARGTLGFCTVHDACGLIGPSTCPLSATGEAQGCTPTNAIRPTGTCDPSGTGLLTPGATCPLPVPTTPDSDQCPHGTLCGGPTGGLTCETICKLDKACLGPTDCPPAMTCATSVCTLPYGTGPDAVCPGTTTCEALFWDPGYDTVPGTIDDVLTSDWGTCR